MLGLSRGIAAESPWTVQTADLTSFRCLQHPSGRKPMAGEGGEGEDTLDWRVQLHTLTPEREELFCEANLSDIKALKPVGWTDCTRTARGLGSLSGNYDYFSPEGSRKRVLPLPLRLGEDKFEQTKDVWDYVKLHCSGEVHSHSETVSRREAALTDCASVGCLQPCMTGRMGHESARPDVMVSCPAET
jgi:hypothetical protein